MLIVVEKGKEHIVQKIYEKWDLSCEQIGEVTSGGRLKYYMYGELVADVPADDLVLGGGAPVYTREYSEPEYFKRFKAFDIDSIEQPKDLVKVAKYLASHPNIASKKWVYEQYDSMVGTINMGTNSPKDAGVVNIKGTNKALALTVDCNARMVNADPQVGCAMAVAEAARNIVCSGAEPSAITNCLNFGNPYNPEVYWQFVGAIKGMSEACVKFNTPVTGGNVSFYNQTVIDGKEVPVFPTPTIGMLGVVQDKANIMSLDFKGKSDLIYTIGEFHNDINSSEYLASYHKYKQSSTPPFDLDKEYALQQLIKELISQKAINSAHDISDGGLFVNLIESAIPNKVGFDITTSSEIREDAFLFGESPSRVVVSVSETGEEKLIDTLKKHEIPFMLLGHITRGDIRVDEKDFGNIEEFSDIYQNALANKLK
jgi:phosphoribosylformylglycinamidine synthase